MGLEDPFISGCTSCMSTTYQFPPITKPGLPNFTLGCFLATFAGINYVLEFIPPTPQKIASLSPPSISLFLDGFMAGIKLPSSYPGFEFGPLVIPGKGVAPYEYDLSGELKLMAVCIMLPFKLITKLVEGLLNLELNIPTLDGIKALFTEIALDVGIEGPSVAKFGGCIAESIVGLFGSLI